MLALTRRRLRRAAFGALVAGGATLAAPHGLEAQPRPPGLVHYATWQSRPTPPLGVVVDPVRVYTAADGTVFVIDRFLSRAQRFTSVGEPLADYGRGSGDGDGEHRDPMGVAADIARELVYVMDTGNSRISVWSLAGEFVANWPTVKPPLAGLVTPGGALVVTFDPSGWGTVDANGEVTLVEMLQPFPTLGDLPNAGPAFRNGILYLPSSLHVERYRLDGAALAPLRVHPDGMRDIRQVTFDGTGRIYVLHGSGWVTRQWTSGLVLREFLGQGVMSMSGAPGRAAFLVWAAGSDGRAQVAEVAFGTSRAEVSHWGDPLTILGWMFNPVRLHTGADGDVYVVDELYRVQRFTQAGEAVGQYYLPGIREAAVDTQGDLYLARWRAGTSDEDSADPDVPPAGTQRTILERRTFDGGFVSGREESGVSRVVWRDDWVEPAGPDATRIAALALDPDRERLVLLDAGRRRVLAYTMSGARVAEFGLPDLAAGFPEYTDLALTPDGFIYVLHTAARRALRLLPDLTVAGWLPVPGQALRLEVTSAGVLAVVTARGWLWFVAPDLAVESVGRLPAAPHAQGEAPADLAVAADGRVLVTDRSGGAILTVGPGGAPDRAPEVDLDCRLAVNTDLVPPAATVGEPVTVTLQIRGTCPHHPRSGAAAAYLVANGALSVTLSAGARLVPGSPSPEADFSGATLTWPLQRVELAGVDLAFQMTVDTPGRRPAFASAGLAAVDGWYGFHGLEAQIPYFVVRTAAPAVPARARAFLPWAAGARR